MVIIFLVFAVIALIVVAAIVVGAYNRLIALKNTTGMRWANIDVLLKQRHDELSKLVETCQQYMLYETTTLESIIRARGAVFSARQNSDVNALGQAETSLRKSLGHLFTLVENYPDLKATHNFQKLQNRISQLENGIADRRESYNEAVNVYNIKREEFPEVVFSSTLGFVPMQLLEFAEG